MLSQDSAYPTAYMQRFYFTLGIVLPLICFLTACGKRRPPLPPTERIPQRTELLSGVQRGNQVILSWPAPRRNASDESVQSIRRVDVYRTDRSQQEPAQTPLNKDLIGPNETSYADQSFRFGEEYTYVVRAVSLGTGGAQVESLNSNAVSRAPKDTFAPSAPTAITVAAAPNRLSLFWPANPERDVAGYNIYRSTDPSLSKDAWTKLNRTLYERTTYQDEAVESGTRYYYYLTAVDTSGNESPPSEVKSEVVP